MEFTFLKLLLLNLSTVIENLSEFHENRYAKANEGDEYSWT